MQLASVLYFVIWAVLFFVMMRYGCGAHIMGHAHHHGETGSSQRGNDQNLRWIPPKQSVDPVCGMTVQTVDAKSAVHDGQVYYFCSQDCRARFEASPLSYTKPKAA